jgi:hypothetical protein
MCDWCGEDKGVEPQVSGIRVPIICSGCGTMLYHMDWRELRELFKKARKWDELNRDKTEKDEING